jgi:hypothetical protein
VHLAVGLGVFDGRVVGAQLRGQALHLGRRHAAVEAEDMRAGAHLAQQLQLHAHGEAAALRCVDMRVDLDGRQHARSIESAARADDGFARAAVLDDHAVGGGRDVCVDVDLRRLRAGRRGRVADQQSCGRRHRGRHAMQRGAFACHLFDLLR